MEVGVANCYQQLTYGHKSQKKIPHFSGVDKTGFDETDNGSPTATDKVSTTTTGSVNHEQVEFNPFFETRFLMLRPSQDLCWLHQLRHQGRLDKDGVPAVWTNSFDHNELGRNDWQTQGSEFDNSTFNVQRKGQETTETRHE